MAHQAFPFDMLVDELSRSRDRMPSPLFNVMITGTIFPLGPSTDAGTLLTHLGGPPDSRGLWEQPLRRGLRRLLYPKMKMNRFPVVALRIRICPFVLRRTLSSIWLIDRGLVRPRPQILKPYPDKFSEDKAKSAFRKQDKNDTQHNAISRADNQRFFAWTSLYGEFLRKTRPGLKDHQKVRLMEGVVRRGMASEKFVTTGRLRRFIAWAKAVHAANEKFIIVFDRLCINRLSTDSQLGAY